MKKQIARAQTMHNTEHIEALLARFQALKQKLIKRGLI